MLNLSLKRCKFSFFFMQSIKLNWKTRESFLTATIYFYNKSFKMLADVYQPESTWRWVEFVVLSCWLFSIFYQFFVGMKIGMNNFQAVIDFRSDNFSNPSQHTILMMTNELRHTSLDPSISFQESWGTVKESLFFSYCF